MSYTIIANNITLDFDGDISVVLNNPMFSSEMSHSLQFTIKDDDAGTNRRAFGYINRPDIDDNKTRELTCQITAGVIMFTGTIVVKYQGGNFACYFKVTGDFWNSIKDKYLSDIPFDVVTFDPEIGYDDIQDVMDVYNTDDNDHPFAFPLIINEKIDSKFPIRVAFSEFLNSLADLGTLQCSIAPFMYVHYIFRSIFERFGLPLNYSALESNKFLKRLLAGSNYLINEFELDTTVVETKNYLITSIENSSDPIVTTALPHNLINYQFIKLSGYYGTENKVGSRVYQIELIYNENPDNPGEQIKDEYSFKLLGEDFSAFDLYERFFFSEISCVHYSSMIYLNLLRIDMEDTSMISVGMYFYLRSNERSGVVIVFTLGDPGWFVVQSPWLTSGLTFTNTSIYQIGNIYGNPVDGTIIVLPSLLINTFKSINPSNHVPYIKINDFLNEFENLGIISFVRQTGVDIKLFKDVINSSEFDDISDITTEIRDIENPDVNGYELKFTNDGNDEYVKTMLPVTAIDPKYIIKDPVASKSNLSPTGSETNDVRLVIDENSYYVFNKSFLNADNNWKFLCYNLVDNTSGEGELKITSKISPCLPRITELPRLNKINVPCSCLTFDTDTKMNLRLLSLYNVNGATIAISDIYDLYGAEIAASEFDIRWESTKGIIEKLLKEKLEWETNVRKDMKTKTLWPEKDLADFDFSRKKQVSGVNYIVKSIKFTMSFKYGRVKHNETELVRV